ncbi:hypothetical protein NP233_g12014 [Leucocoprinus birnbaumii]|uniref:Uncharacterized protein n=1 Tax=Leucocoprinus birnbaumii TaxID=56174 RepID=A0AAD5YQD4_9AGAR|nr:hypothetical protein NP233_g12014 [Leucocoprinus birnbaumii]
MNLISARSISLPARLTINQDVWLEVLRYFRISLAEDSTGEIRGKRATLLSAALSCPAIAEPALDELWRSMTSLEAVLGVFGDASYGKSVGLVFVEDDDDESWDLSMSPAESSKYLPRIQKSLQRVRYLHFDSWPSDKELSLWQSLAALIRTPVLCSNLKSLWLDMQNFCDGDLISAPCLFLILSSTLKTLTLLNCPKGPRLRTAHLLLSMLKSHDTSLLEISYHGHTDDKTFRLISEFPSLKSIKIREYLDSEDDEGYLKIEDFKDLRHNASLTTIEFDIDIVSVDDEEELGPSLTSLEALCDLTLCIH